ncbi:hypothetical protein VPH35_045339 [Triticum aestivum]
MHDQGGLDQDGFPLDHEFPEDYRLEEEDESDIEGEPLFEDKLASRAAGEGEPKRKNRRTKAYTTAEDKLLCIPSFGCIQGPTRWQVLQPFPLLEGHQRRGEVQDTICRPHVAWGKKAVEEVGDGEKPQSRGKTNSNKEDKRDVASNALIATVKEMMTKKDSREEKRRKDKEDQMNAFMEIQRRRLEMEAEKQTRMLEMEAKKQAKMLEIEAANAKTKAKEVALASMMTGVEIMKVDLNTVSPRKRPWFKKMQADMLKFDAE